jgi:DNA-binding IclR family transcriptional regulator
MKEPLSLPGRQREALRHVQASLAAGKQPSHAWLAEQMGCSKGTAQRFLNALRAKGLLQGPELVGDWKLTRAGKKLAEQLDG